MKRFFLSLFMISLFILLSITADIYIEKSNTQLDLLLKNCLVSAEKNKLSDIDEHCFKANVIWNSRRSIYSFLIHTGKIRAFSDSLDLLVSQANKGNYDNIEFTIMQCIQTLSDISQSEKLSLENILKMTAVSQQSFSQLFKIHIKLTLNHTVI